jgi:hypothetical protein
VFPLVAARMELILIAGVLVVVPFSSVLTAETELMAVTYFPGNVLLRTRQPEDTRHPTGKCKLLKNHSKNKDRGVQDEAEVAPCGATSRVALLAGLAYWTSFNTAC